MSDRCIVRVKFTPAGAGADVRRAVGGFLRYVQHRDVHPNQPPARQDRQIAGLLKYVAYRDLANRRAELFGPDGAVGTAERKRFADFVGRSVEDSQPQVSRARDGQLMDRRRAVSRFVISPERAHGLDLERLTRAAVARIESESEISGLRWIAAIHRNTRHHHVHLVLAGMHQDSSGVYRRVDLTKSRLAAVKDTVALEIQRQREERIRPQAARVQAALPPRAAQAQLISVPPATALSIGRRMASPVRERIPSAGADISSSVIQLRALARRYQCQMQRDAEAEARRMRWERAA